LISLLLRLLLLLLLPLPLPQRRALLHKRRKIALQRQVGRLALGGRRNHQAGECIALRLFLILFAERGRVAIGGGKGDAAVPRPLERACKPREAAAHCRAAL
jgi:hypothetical protein